jgi:hypothetical protein
MKKQHLNTKLYLKKKKIASLDFKNIKGGIRVSDETTIDNSLGKQSTCPIETCTCADPVRL